MWSENAIHFLIHLHVFSRKRRMFTMNTCSQTMFCVLVFLFFIFQPLLWTVTFKMKRTKNALEKSSCNIWGIEIIGNTCKVRIGWNLWKVTKGPITVESRFRNFNFILNKDISASFPLLWMIMHSVVFSLAQLSYTN